MIRFLSALNRLSAPRRLGRLELAAAGTTFFAVNPFLYRDPIYRTIKLFLQRGGEMRIQFKAAGNAQIRGGRHRVEVVTTRIFETHASPKFPGSPWFNLTLTGIGGFVAVSQIARWMRTGQGSAAPLVLAAVGCAVIGPTLLTPLDWDRYFLLPVVFTTTAIAVGTAFILKTAAGRLVVESSLDSQSSTNG